MFKIFLILLALYALACVFLYVKQRALLYHPTAPVELPQVQVLWLHNDNERLKIWQLNQGTADTAVIYFGGNAEAVEDNLSEFAQRFAGLHVFVANYRGYGGSSGKPSEDALFSDALALYDELAKTHSSIQIIGRSLGSGVASYVAANRPVKKLVLVTPYDSIAELAQTHYPWMPAKWLIHDRFDTLSRVNEISGPILVLLSEEDLTVPHQHSHKLIAALGDKVIASKTILNCNHATIDSNSDYLNELQAFLQ